MTLLRNSDNMEMHSTVMADHFQVKKKPGKNEAIVNKRIVLANMWMRAWTPTYQR